MKIYHAGIVHAWWLEAATLENLAVASVHKVYRKYMDCICE